MTSYLATGVLRSPVTVEITGFHLVQVVLQDAGFRRIGAPVWFSLPSVVHLVRSGQSVYLPSRLDAGALGTELRIDDDGAIVERDRTGATALISDLPNL